MDRSIEGAEPAVSAVVLAREPAMRVGPLRVEPSHLRVCHDDGREEPLQPRVMQVLIALLRAEGEIVTRDELTQGCWGGVVVGEDAINRVIGRLRRLSEGIGEGWFEVETVTRVGYRLACGDPATDIEPVHLEARSAPGPSICVLPFDNWGGDPEQEYFADGISEDIITDLSKVSALMVIARNTAFTFKGRSVDIKQAAHQLDVTHVLEGSVRKSGQRVRIAAQLIDGRTGGHVWAERWDRDLGDIFALQDEISQATVSALKLKLFPQEKQAIEDRGACSLEAYDMYMRARALTGQLNYERAIELYRQTLALDPDFSRGWSGLVTALVNYLNYPSIAPEQRSALLADLNAAVRRLAESAPDAPITPYARAFQRLLKRDFLGAEQFLRLAPAVSPSELSDNLVLRSNIRFYESVGHFTDVLAIYRELVRVDPLSLLFSVILQQHLDITGRREAAQAEYERSRDLAGNREVAEFFAFVRIWGRARPDEVQAQYRRALACAGPVFAHPVFSQVADALDDPTRASALLRAAFEDPAIREDAPLAAQLSHLAGLFGDHDLALAAMRRSYVDLGFLPLRGLWRPELADARKDERFKQILRDLGLADYWRSSGRWGDFVRPAGEGDFEVVG
jgi:adenylate cyclase